MICPLCNSPCLHSIHKDLDRISFNCRHHTTEQSFVCYTKLDKQTIIGIYIYLPSLTLLHHAGSWRIEDNNAVIANGNDNLTPESAYQLILRYQRLIAFS